MSDIIIKQSGAGLGGLLLLLFVGLKLTGQISWSWWVASPIWLPTVIILGVSFAIGIFVGILALLYSLTKRK